MKNSALSQFEIIFDFHSGLKQQVRNRSSREIVLRKNKLSQTVPSISGGKWDLHKFYYDFNMWEGYFP